MTVDNKPQMEIPNTQNSRRRFILEFVLFLIVTSGVLSALWIKDNKHFIVAFVSFFGVLSLVILVFLLVQWDGERKWRKSQNTEDILAGLQKYLKQPCREELSLWISDARNQLSKEYVETLCRYLEIDKECINHESVVEILYELNDARSVPYLEKALYYRKKLDPTQELAKLTLATLAKIDTSEAVAIIQKIANESESDILREEALRLLEV